MLISIRWNEVFFSNIKNDISFLMDDLVIVLIEHQTTINPNMPLRFLSYLDELYRRIVSGQLAKIYGSELLKVPAPEFYVFLWWWWYVIWPADIKIK